MKLFPSIKQNFTNPIVFFYRVILPFMNFIIMIIISPQLDRIYFLGNSVVDFIARIWICLSFSYGYIYLDRFNKTLRLEGDDSARDENISTAIILAIRAVLIGLLVSIITKWITEEFLSFMNKLSLLVGIAHGLIFALPLGYPRNIFLMHRQYKSNDL